MRWTWTLVALALALCPVIRTSGCFPPSHVHNSPLQHSLQQHRRASRERERRLCEAVAVERMARVAAASRQRIAWETYVRRVEHLLRRKEDASFQVLTLESFKRQLKTLSARCSLASSFPSLFLFACGHGTDVKRIDAGRCRMHDSKLSQKEREDARRNHSLLVAALSHSLPGPHPKPCPPAPPSAPSPTLYPFFSPSPAPPLDTMAVERPKYRGALDSGGVVGGSRAASSEQVRLLRICWGLNLVSLPPTVARPLDRKTCCCMLARAQPDAACTHTYNKCAIVDLRRTKTRCCHLSVPSQRYNKD
jgi:hypothetical protein